MESISLFRRRRGVVPADLTASCDRSSCYASGGAQGRYFCCVGGLGSGLIDAGSSQSAWFWFKSIGAGPSLAASFRIGRCRPIVGGVGVIICFPAKW